MLFAIYNNGTVFYFVDISEREWNLSMTAKQEKEFTVVMRGTSSVIFKPNENFLAESFPSSVGPVKILYASRWIKSNENVTIPGHLWIEIKGKGTKLDDVLPSFANAGLALLPLLSLAANAAIGDPDVEIGFDSSIDTHEREFFQNYVPPESGFVHFARQIKINETVALLNKLNQNPEADRIRRAANQYRLALDSWLPGKEALSLAHLWMALEVLTKARIRTELKKRNIATEQELADCLGVELKKLDPVVRRDLILNGDEDCYSKSKKASDGFEHGFLGFDKIHDLARDTRHRMAQYIREEIFNQLELDKETYDVLTQDKPMGYWPIVKYVRGKLIGENAELAAQGNAYPFLKWEPSVNKCEITDEGKINIEYSENFTAELGDGIEFMPLSYEAWKPG